MLKPINCLLVLLLGLWSPTLGAVVSGLALGGGINNSQQGHLSLLVDFPCHELLQARFNSQANFSAQAITAQLSLQMVMVLDVFTYVPELFVGAGARFFDNSPQSVLVGGFGLRRYFSLSWAGALQIGVERIDLKYWQSQLSLLVWHRWL